MPNHLIKETSPYLLQHAHNPVDWYPWGDEALTKAKAENKPILVSIGYAACHWCHVMEKESFEDSDTAALMNQHFINIKIDREERPDLDHIYMEAVQAISGSGGWPLNVFLTPDRKPFYGGTYFPPQALYNRASWTDTLLGVSKAFANQRNEIEAQAENLTEHIEASNRFGLSSADDPSITESEQKEMIANLLKTADTVHGGFGDAPKFPQTFSIRLLLQHYFFYKDRQALDHACLSLDKMIGGGIHDQIGGGFARYSTDAVWMAPHFEKMLYDNALLVMALSEAWQATHNDLYIETIDSTIGFIQREMMSPEGGFYAALDADSEGVEGKFYVWSKNEIVSILGGDAELFCSFYNVSEQGNWEHANILHRTMNPVEFATINQLDLKRFTEILRTSTRKLLAHRTTRVRPATDDKILLGWNAMMNTACSKAFAATGNEHHRTLAISNMKFLLSAFADGDDGHFFHTFKAGEAKYPAFLDDYACLIEALINLQEITGDQRYLQKVKTLVKWVTAHFNEEETGYFYYTNTAQEDVIVRKKELYDGAVPSGNSLMAWNLAYCGVVFDNAEWRARAAKMCSGLKDVVRKYPGSFGIWGKVTQALSNGIPEIAITGADSGILLKDILRIFIPFRVLQSSPSEATGFPLLGGKSFAPSPIIYLCKDYACQSPVNEVPAFQVQLDNIYSGRHAVS